MSSPDKSELHAQVQYRLIEELTAAHQRLQEYNQQLEYRVKERTQELAKTLEHLKATQQELIQVEKMAALGQLVAGIAHEINTPLGAISASIGNIKKGLNNSIEQLPKIFKLLSEERQQDFLALVEHATHTKNLSSREERQAKKTMMIWLAEHHLEPGEELATNLINIGIYDGIEPYLALFQEAEIISILKAAHNLSRQKKNSDIIEQALEKVSRIVFSLRSYTHMEHSGEMVKANIIENLEVVLTLYHNQLKQGIKIIKHYEDIPPMVCYPDELNQVWINLIQNAVHAMSNKGILEIGVFKRDSYVVVSFTDTGYGIPKDILPRIFEPFFTTKPQGEGSGLGLDIVRKVTEKHAGHIEVESCPGRTTFAVFLPIEK